MRIIFILLFTLLGSNVLASLKLITKQNPHDYQILADEDLGSEVKEEDFYFIVNEVHRLYLPEARKQNRIMVIGTLDWQRPYFSAWARYDKHTNTYQTNFWGGFARLPDMTKRAFAFTACHEVGHLLGKAPRINTDGMKEMSTEGQSDFFAANSCFKRFVMENPAYFKRLFELDPYAASMCEEEFREDSTNRNLCYETMQVARDFTLAINYVNRDILPDFHTPDTLVVTKTKESYPSLQCRMDIIVNSALMPYNRGEISQKSLRERLPCWFADSGT